jgi:aspartate aminotransferase-like enzyme
MINTAITMIPGPTPVHPRILARLAEPTVSHLFPAFIADYRETLDNFRALMRSASAQPVIFGGGGTLSMEMALVNIMAPGEKLLILSQGYFGDRFAALAESFAIPYDIVQAAWGHAVAPEELESRLSASRYGAVTITHVDTSTGTCAPAADYCRILRGRDELVILDGVCASGGIDERFDDWGVDVLLTAPQKAFGAPPGLAMCLFGARAIAKRRSLPRIPAYYADLLRWLPIMENPGTYYSTPAVNQILALHEATRIMMEEGLDRRFARHQAIGRAMRAGMAAIGFEPFTAPDCRADTLSVLRYPAGVADGEFRASMAAAGVTVAGCLGPIAGQAFRIGHMGNIGAEEIIRTLRAAETSLRACGTTITDGAATAAAAAHMNW